MRLHIYIMYIKLHALCRYASRCILIEFDSPALSSSVTKFTELVKLYKSSSSCIGFCISLGEVFFKEGVLEVDHKIIPMLQECCGPNISPRVIPAYAILYWFASKVPESILLHDGIIMILFAFS